MCGFLFYFKLLICFVILLLSSTDFNLSISLANFDVCQTSDPVRDIKYALAKVENLCVNVYA